MIHAKELLQQSSELGLSKSSNLLGDWYIKKIIPGDNYKEAFKLYTRGCEFGDMRSFSRLAMCYEKGYGIKRKIYLRHWNYMKNQWNWEIRMPVSVLQEYMKRRKYKNGLI